MVSFIAISTAYGSQGWTSYNTTYDMYKNVNTGIHNVSKGYVVNIEPIAGTWNCDMEIYKYEWTFWGKRATDYFKSTSSVSKSKVVISQ